MFMLRMMNFKGYRDAESLCSMPTSGGSCHGGDREAKSLVKPSCFVLCQPQGVVATAGIANSNP